jgi:hypothetical protein
MSQRGKRPIFMSPAEEAYLAKAVAGYDGMCRAARRALADPSAMRPILQNALNKYDATAERENARTLDVNATMFGETR